MSCLPTERVRAPGAIAGIFLLSFAVLAHASRWEPRKENTNQRPILTSNTDVVALPVSVTDAHGVFVAGLMKDNFRVFEDGRLQTISFFEQVDTPVTVGLIVDHSGSMGPKLREVAAAVRAFAHLSNPEDEMFVVDFDDAVSVELLHGKPFTSDAQELSGAVTAVSAAGQTALYDALAEGFIHLRLGQRNQRALIVVSDGGDNISRYKFSQILAMARSSDAVIYAIGLLSESGQEENPGVLRRLCHETGGVAFFPPKGASIEAISNQIAGDLREQYLLGYVPPIKTGDGSFHKIEVKVSASDRGTLRVRSRVGYSAAPTSPAESGRRAQ
jgi:Ca-activated chloride channel homolog